MTEYTRDDLIAALRDSAILPSGRVQAAADMLESDRDRIAELERRLIKPTIAPGQEFSTEDEELCEIAGKMQAEGVKFEAMFNQNGVWKRADLWAFCDPGHTYRRASEFVELTISHPEGAIMLAENEKLRSRINSLENEIDHLQVKLSTVADLIDDVLYVPSFRPRDENGDLITGKAMYLADGPIMEGSLPALRRWLFEWHQEQANDEYARDDLIAMLQLSGNVWQQVADQMKADGEMAAEFERKLAEAQKPDVCDAESVRRPNARAIQSMRDYIVNGDCIPDEDAQAILNYIEATQTASVDDPSLAHGCVYDGNDIKVFRGLKGESWCIRVSDGSWWTGTRYGSNCIDASLNKQIAKARKLAGLPDADTDSDIDQSAEPTIAPGQEFSTEDEELCEIAGKMQAEGVKFEAMFNQDDVWSRGYRWEFGNSRITYRRAPDPPPSEAAVTSDDLDQPVTPEWLDLRGEFEQQMTGGDCKLWLCGKVMVTWRGNVKWFPDDKRGSVVVYVGDPLQQAFISRNPTRRQLLDLVRVLTEIGGE